MKGRLGDRIRLIHIQEAIYEIDSYLEGIEFFDFLNNSMLRFACIKQLEIIGEAANHLSSEIKENHSNIPWQEIIGLRNFLIHEYFGIDHQIVWNILTLDIPIFKSNLDTLLDSLQ